MPRDCLVTELEPPSHGNMGVPICTCVGHRAELLTVHRVVMDLGAGPELELQMVSPESLSMFCAFLNLTTIRHDTDDNACRLLHLRVADICLCKSGLFQ